MPEQEQVKEEVRLQPQRSPTELQFAGRQGFFGPSSGLRASMYGEERVVPVPGKAGKLTTGPRYSIYLMKAVRKESNAGNG
jgi:hypothetical protein